MENTSDQRGGYYDVIETLVQAFRQVLSEDVIAAIVENCGGDLNESANAIMNMATDDESQNVTEAEATSNMDEQQVNQQASSTYSERVGSTSDGARLVNSNNSAKNKNKTSQKQAHTAMRNQTESNAGSTSNTNCPRPLQNQKKSGSDIKWTPQTREIITQHGKGNRILIIMRGAPGSGKTFLAKKIVEMTIGSHTFDYKTHIFSADDFFMRGNVYHFDKNRLQEAHAWNHSRANVAMCNGLSPVIIDNTNIALWEMEPYVRLGTQNGYLIHVVEPNTPWAKKLNQLIKRNSHGVPAQAIKRMLENYQNGVNSEYLMKFYKLSYPQHMTPPVMRNFPQIQTEPMPEETVSETKQREMHNTVNVIKTPAKENVIIPPVSSTTNSELNQDIITKDQKVQDLGTLISNNDQLNSDVAVQSPQSLEEYPSKDYSAILKQLEEFAKVEEEWEKGESWDYDTPTTSNSAQDGDVQLGNLSEGSKPQRKSKKSESNSNDINVIGSTFNDYNKSDIDVKESSSEHKTSSDSGSETMIVMKNISNDNNLDENVSVNSDDVKSNTESDEIKSHVENFIGECQDWTKISMFMPPWGDEIKFATSELTIKVETLDSSTCVEVGDTDLTDTKKPIKILTATARDINLYYVPIDKEKIPEKRMLDKSSMTNEQMFPSKAVRCKNEEKHFSALRKMFRHIDKDNLREIFDCCCGDVNWAVNILLSGVSAKLSVADEDDVDLDDEITEQCECLAAYDIIPDKKSGPTSITNSEPVTVSSSDSTPQRQRKSRKEVSVSETSIELKRQIEKNIVIPDNHYSEYFLKVRKTRRGEGHSNNNDITENSETCENEDNENQKDSKESKAQDERCINNSNDCTYADSDEEHFEIEYKEETVNLDLGSSFVSQLDNFFGREGFQYPSDVVPKINIPLSLLKEINALWMESIMDQLDSASKESEMMLTQDEQFARELALKENELAVAGKESEVPNLKEIMDMEFALSLYHKDIEDWRSKQPNDLAAKLTRQKLFNLFPDISPDVLSELLVAHDNKFEATIEGLLISMGKEDVLQSENGLNRFVMQKELERQCVIVAEEKKALSEAEWPMLQKEKLEMSVVDGYRKEAEMCLAKRNYICQLAGEYMRRGVLDVASYYFEVADLHKRKYEYANSLAAASLMQLQAAKNTDKSTVDLHFLRVAEARESLDIFLDSHIQKIRELGKPRSQTLFLITGRGLHSPGLPKIKPAVKKRLMQRGIFFRERNPGLLAAKVHAGHQLSYQIA